MGFGSWCAAGVATVLLVACGESGKHSSTGTGGMAPGAGGSAGAGAKGGAANAGGGGMGGGGMGGGAAGTSAGDGGVGTDGGGGPEAGNGGSGGSLPLVDPDPAEPDLTGLVPTSRRWLLLSATGKVPGWVALYDLETGTYHDADPDKLADPLDTPSPDRKVIAYAADDGGPMSLLRFTDTGFVPTKAIQGLGDTSKANFFFAEWAGDSRFFGVARGGSENHGIDIIDGVLRQRVAHIPMAPTSDYDVKFAPQGPFFTFYRREAHEASIARVVQGGVSDPLVLPQGTTIPEFSRDGARAFFATTDDKGQTRQFFLQLPDGAPQELEVAKAGETFYSVFKGPSPDSMFAIVTTAEAELLVQVFVDGRPRVELSDPTRKIHLLHQSSDGNVLAISYEDGIDILQIAPYARFSLPGVTLDNGSWTTGVIGHHVYHQVDGKVFVAWIDEQGSLHDVAVDEPGALVGICGFPFTEETQTKLAYRVSKHEIAVVDLNAVPPQVAARVTSDESQFPLECPHFSVDESSFAVLDGGSAGYRIYGMKWNGTTPGETKLLLESSYMRLNGVSL